MLYSVRGRPRGKWQSQCFNIVLYNILSSTSSGIENRIGVYINIYRSEAEAAICLRFLSEKHNPADVAVLIPLISVRQVTTRILLRDIAAPSLLSSSCCKGPKIMAFSLRRTVLYILFIASAVLAHEHHDELTEEESNAPVDSVLWLHMILQGLVWGVLFPVGMVLGLTKSRWHVPVQVCLSEQYICHHRC